MDDLNNYSDQVIGFIGAYGPTVLGALIVLILGLWLISWITKLTKRGFKKGKFDESLIPFLASLVNWTLKALLLISVASMVGIATTSFIAVLGAAGLAIGLALQGTLANFAGGVMILLFKPYKLGDLIEAQGYLGIVEEIQIFVIKLRSPQNELIIIPNGAISNGSLKNFTETPARRIDCTIGISYDSDIKKAKEILRLMKPVSRYRSHRGMCIFFSKAEKGKPKFYLSKFETNSNDSNTKFKTTESLESFENLRILSTC